MREKKGGLIRELEGEPEESRVLEVKADKSLKTEVVGGQEVT